MGLIVMIDVISGIVEQSQQATEETSHLITTIQQDTARAVETMAAAETKTGSAAICAVGSTFCYIQK